MFFSNRTFLTKLYLPFLCLLFTVSCNNSETAQKGSLDVSRTPISVKALVDKPEVTIGDIITYSITINRKNSINIDLSGLEVKADGLTLVKLGSDPSAKVGDRVEERKWYRFRAEDLGSYIIPSFSIGYVDTTLSEENLNQVTTSKIYIEVKSVIKEGEAVSDIKDIKPLILLKKDYKTIIIILSVTLVIIVLLIYLVWRRRKRKEPPIIPEVPPLEAALIELNQLREEDLLSRRQFRKYYFSLSEIMRHFMEKVYFFPALEHTTQEIKDEYCSRAFMQSSLFKQVYELLNEMDMVKFANVRPSMVTAGDTFDRIEQLIRSMHMDEQVRKLNSGFSDSDQTGQGEKEHDMAV